MLSTVPSAVATTDFWSLIAWSLLLTDNLADSRESFADFTLVVSSATFAVKSLTSWSNLAVSVVAERASTFFSASATALAVFSTVDSALVTTPFCASALFVASVRLFSTLVVAVVAWSRVSLAFACSALASATTSGVTLFTSVIWLPKSEIVFWLSATAFSALATTPPWAFNTWLAWLATTLASATCWALTSVGCATGVVSALVSFATTSTLFAVVLAEVASSALTTDTPPATDSANTDTTAPVRNFLIEPWPWTSFLNLNIFGSPK